MNMAWSDAKAAPKDDTKRRIGKVERRIKRDLKRQDGAQLWLHFDDGRTARAVPKHIAEAAVAALEGEFNGDRNGMGLRVVRGGRA